MMIFEVCIIERMPPERRTKQSTVRMTVSEKKILKDFANAQGLDLSTMFRRVGLKAAEKAARKARKEGIS